MGDTAQMKVTFKDYAKGKSGTELTSKDASKWFTDAKLLSKSGRCTSNDLDIQHSKAKGKGSLTVDKMEDLIKFMAKSYAVDKKITEDEAKAKITTALANAKRVVEGTKQSATGGVDRMTDTSKYTGAHKERFDESGKGKGIDGRSERAENTGYVGAYKGAGTYDKK